MTVLITNIRSFRDVHQIFTSDSSVTFENPTGEKLKQFMLITIRKSLKRLLCCFVTRQMVRIISVQADQICTWREIWSGRNINSGRNCSSPDNLVLVAYSPKIHKILVIETTYGKTTNRQDLITIHWAYYYYYACTRI